ncbi:MAG: hypothetical protein ACK4YO_00665 [Candidatus Altarchaeaceae archaeon]
MSNKYVVPIGILVAVILIIAGGYMMLNPLNTGSKTTINLNGNESNYIQPTERGFQQFTPNITATAEKLTKNADLKFKVGDMYKYNYNTVTPANGTDMSIRNVARSLNITLPRNTSINIETKTTSIMEINVDRIERCNNSNCFVLRYLTIQKIENLDEIVASLATASGKKIGENEMKAIIQLEDGTKTSGEIWVNKDGEIVKTLQEMNGRVITIEGARSSFFGFGGINFGPNAIIQPWMLALNENFEWKKESTIEMRNFTVNSTETYKVIDIEEITTKAGKKNCYKVENTVATSRTFAAGQRNRGNSVYFTKTILWIDKEKRILIKAEVWIENLKIADIELVEEKSA